MNKPAIKITTWAAIITIALCSVLPNLIPAYWLIDLFSHFKVQYLILCLLMVVPVYLFLDRKKTALMVLLFSAAWNAFFIIPYYIPTEQYVKNNSSQLKITSINLLSSNANYNEVRALLSEKDPDVLILMEFNDQWHNELSVIIQDYPYKKLLPGIDNFGIALLSRHRMQASEVHFAPGAKPSIVGKLAIGDHLLTVVATHPVPPVNSVKFRQRNQQLRGIISQRNKLGENLVIAGDLNTSSFSNHFQSLLNEDLRDSRKGFGLLPTWPADFSIMRTTLDHFIISENLRVIERRAGNNIGSDHLPVHLTLAFDQLKK